MFVSGFAATVSYPQLSDVCFERQVKGNLPCLGCSSETVAHVAIISFGGQKPETYLNQRKERIKIV